MKKSQLVATIILCSLHAAKAGVFSPSDSIKVSKIWDQAEHSAFTDLIRFNDAFYCSFREGASHVGGENSGKVRIITSKHGDTWESVALLDSEGIDLRDPKLSVTPTKQIMVIMAGAVFDEHGVIQELSPMVSFSDKSGKKFSLPEKSVLDPAITPSKDWIWRIAWHQGVGYGIDYQLKENAKDRQLLKKDAWLLYLMKTKDGKSFEKVSQLAVDDLPNESTIRFDKHGKMYVLIRREAGDKRGVLATSDVPYTAWKYSKLDVRLGGPNFLFLNDERLVMGTRIYEPQTSTGILVTDLQGNVLKTINLPSGGDTSYPGMVIYQEKLWVSYYSSHEDKSTIYLAEIPLNELRE